MIDAEQSGRAVVGDGQDAVVVRARGQSTVALLRGGVELCREYAAVEEMVFPVGPGDYEVRTDGELLAVEAVGLPAPEAAAPAARSVRLRLTADAPDRHAVDGVGEIPADGTSHCTVTVELIDADGARVAVRGPAAEVFLRTTGGTLLDGRGRDRIRSVRLRSGRATFRLVAEDTPRFVTVHALDRAGATAELPVEFVAL